MPVIAFEQNSHTVPQEYGPPLPSAKGYVDGETFRKQRKEPPLHALVGIDDYSEGFRAGYYQRPISERALSRVPKIDDARADHQLATLSGSKRSDSRLTTA